ncbi:MAG: gamma-glutamyltransferase [Acidobacteriota bacterium]
MTGTLLSSRREFLAGSLAVASRLAAAPAIAEGPEVLGTRGVIATEAPEAARAGARLFQQGGNAFDAAAAAAIAACMLEPQMVDLGGYVACAVALEGSTGRVRAIDANSVAPAAARAGMFQVLPLAAGPRGINENEYGCSVRDNANVYGPLAVSVPGTLAGIGVLWERWGRAKWPAILAPARELLERGFEYGGVADAIQAREANIRKYEPTVRHLMPDGRVPRRQDKWRRPDMEKTLARLAAAGWRDLYEGELARRVADFVAAAGGLLSRADLAAFQPRVTAPYETTYRGARIAAAPLASGGLTVLEILHMLERFEPLGEDDPRHWHRLVEIFKLAWRDRLLYLADPDQAPVPVERFLSKDYAAGRVETLRAFPDSVDRLPAPAAAPSPGTVHLSAADSEGNLVAITISNGGWFGSCLTVPGTGIILGHGMCRFDPRPGRPNSVAPRKRPLNNVCPTILRMPGRDVACGMRGGRRILSVVAQISQRLADYGWTGRQAVTAPRLHVEMQEPLEVTDSLSAAIVEKLRAMGHAVNPMPKSTLYANAAERLSDGRLRASGDVWAAGV